VISDRAGRSAEHHPVCPIGRGPRSAAPGRSSPPVLRPRKALRHAGHALAYLAIVFLGLDFAAEAYFISLNWVNPPVTAYILESGGEHLHDYVSLGTSTASATRPGTTSTSRRTTSA